MSGLFSILNSTAQALDAQSVAIDVTSSNIANINNPNYSREYVVDGTNGETMTPQGEEATGLAATSVQQYSDSLLNQQIISQLGVTASSTSQQSWLQQAQAVLGQNLTSAATSSSSTSTSTSASGLASALNNLMDSFSALAAQPTDSGTRATLVQQASTLTQTFQSIDSSLAQVQANADTQNSTDVASANKLLTSIASLNTQIAAAEVNNPGSAVNLRDTREADLEQLGGIIPVTVTEQSNGEDTVTSPDGSGNPITLVSLGTVQGGLNYSNGTVTGGVPSTTLGLASGSIQGSIAASTGTIQTLRTDLNNLAGQVVTSVNAAYNPSGGAGGDFFDPAGTTAGTIALAPGLNSSTLVAGTGAAGDNSIALSVAALANTSFSTASGDSIDGTFSSYYANSVGNFGASLANVTSNLDDQTNVQTLLQTQRSSISGVNMDEEMSNLVQFQQAYEASSETFNIVNQLLGTEITSMGSST